MVTQNNDETLTHPLLKGIEDQQPETAPQLTGVEHNTRTSPVRSYVLDEDDRQSVRVDAVPVIETSREVEILRRQIYDSNIYNEQLNNVIAEEENLSGLKTAGRVGFDLALIFNNVSQLYYLWKSNGEVWPDTWQVWLLVASLGCQFLAFCLFVVEACLGCSQRGDPQSIRRIFNSIMCGLMYCVAILNFLIQSIGWDGPISTNHCSANCTTEAIP